MSDDVRQPRSAIIPLLLGGAILLAAAAILSLAPLLRCPACTRLEPGYRITVTHTGPCEFCRGTDRLALPGWFKARKWRSQAYVKE